MRAPARWFVLLVVPLLAVPFLSACGPSGDGGGVVNTRLPAPTAKPTVAVVPTPSAMVTYQHPGGLFAISYPRGWQVAEEAEQVSFTSSDGLLRVLVQYSDLGKTLDEQGMRTLVDAYFSPDGFGGQPNFVREGDTVQPDGSIRVDYTFDYQGRQVRGNSFFQQSGTISYIVSFWALDATRWESALPAFSDIANSFQTAQAPNDVTAGWSVLTSSAGEYEIKVPTGWQTAESGGNALVQKDAETFLSILMTTTLPASDSSQVEQMLTEEKLAALRADDPNAQVSGPGTLLIGGQEGVYADFTYVDPGTGLENNGTVISVVYHQRAYVMLLFTLSKDAEQNVPVFTSILLSFRFTK
jgi:hypothetical protein